MLELSQEQTVEGYWTIHYKNGKQSKEFYGVLSYKPEECIYLKITAKNESTLVIDLEINNLEVSRIVGNTNSGTCFLFDVFLMNRTVRGWLTSFTIVANLASFAQKLGQTVEEKYIVYDLKTDKEDIFFKCTFEVEGLFPIINFISKQSSSPEEKSIFNFSILKNGSIDYKNFDDARSYLSKNCKIQLNDDIELKFIISYSESHGFDGIKKTDVNILCVLSSNNKSISKFINCAFNIVRILRTIFDNNRLYIKNISTSKSLVGRVECDALNAEIHTLLFNQTEFYDGKRLTLHNIPINSLGLFKSVVEKSYAMADKHIDIFKSIVKTDTHSIVDDIILLVKLIEGASTWLCDESCEPKYNFELKNELTKRLSGLPEMNDIINEKCKPGAKKCFVAVLESAKNIIPKEWIDTHKVSTDVYKIRSQESHGKINYHFKSKQICIHELFLHQRYLRAVFYVQLFKKLGIDDKIIKNCQSFLELRSQIKKRAGNSQLL